MFRNFIKAALRNVKSNKLFSAINIFGLAIGISASLVIFLIVQYDFSFDKFESGSNRIYRVVTKDWARVPISLDKNIHNEVTGVNVIASFIPWDNYVHVRIDRPGDESPLSFLNEPNIVFTDNQYFKLIHYKWLAGSPESSLSEINQAVLTEQSARRFFPHLSLNDVIGKEITFDDSVRTTVTGIVENLKYNSDFIFQTFVSIETQKSLMSNQIDNWGGYPSSLFIKLSKNANPKQITSQIQKVYGLHVKPVSNSSYNFYLEPLSDLHFSKLYDGDSGPGKADKSVLYGLIALAGILLLLACINFINLTTAQSSQRAKEIGVRKTLGGSRKQLIFQFLSETFILTLIATLLSIIFAPLLLKAFSGFIPEGVHFNIQRPEVILFLIITTVLVSLFAGIYPALILSSYKPVTVLKNQSTLGAGTRKLFFRKTLTVSQFVIAQVFIIATIIVGRQIHYELNKDMGFKKEAIIYFGTKYTDTSVAKRMVLFQKLKSIPEIADVSLAGFPPSTGGGAGLDIQYNDEKQVIDTQVRIKPVDTNYIKLYHIKLLAGRNLPYSDTTNSFLINEKCSQMLGFKDPQEAIGKYVESSFWEGQKMPIVGVVANFIQGSVKDEIMPLILFSNTSMQLTFNLALQPQNAEGSSWKNAIIKIGKDFKKIYPDTEFDVHFLDESIAQYYATEQNLSLLLKWATGLAITISCLGLLGLVIYTTNQRTKEIGIRKVLGASISQIITLLSKDFLKLVLLAFIIAAPIVWITADKWLQNFAFKIELNAWLFIIGGLIMLFPAVIILLIRTYYTANVNPVESLKNE